MNYRYQTSLAALTAILMSCGGSATPVAQPATAATPVPRAEEPSADVALGGDYRAVASKIAAAAMANHAAYDKLAYLTDRIGARLSGSLALERAIAWAGDRLRADGHENVRAEPVMVPHWVRGAESAAVTAPTVRSLRVLGLGGTVPTPEGGIEAAVAKISSWDEFQSRASELTGKIVLIDFRMPPYSEEHGTGYGESYRYRTKGPSAAARAGAVALLMRSATAHSLQTPHTGRLGYEDGVPAIPAAAITLEDADYLTRLLASGDEVRVRLSLSSETKPDAQSANVIAELVGSERPEEIVVIGAHIDSWDVGQGAHDDGAGCVMVMQALTVLRELGLKPRRTIRVVLFTNEENGLRGPIEYAKQHQAELVNHVVAMDSDLGGFAPRGFEVEASHHPRARADVAAVLSLLPQEVGSLAEKAGDAGANVWPLVAAGVPGLGVAVALEHYFDYHHTEADTLDKVDADDLAKNVAMVAVTAYVLADMPRRFGTPLVPTGPRPDAGPEAPVTSGAP